MSLFPLAAFDVMDDVEANAALETWGHYLGENNRPFGRQSFGLYLGPELISVAVSASTVSATCAGFSRFEVVELARLVTKPGEKAFTRVSLRLWRQLAPAAWVKKYHKKWPVVHAVVSYSNETRHKGDIYRFDGWEKVGVMRGSMGGGTYTSKQPREDKALWMFDLRKAAA